MKENKGGCLTDGPAGDETRNIQPGEIMTPLGCQAPQPRCRRRHFQKEDGDVNINYKILPKDYYCYCVKLDIKETGSRNEPRGSPRNSISPKTEGGENIIF